MASRPHVLISDIAMPGEDGYDLIKKVIALELVPKISASSQSLPMQKKKTGNEHLAAGFQRYLSKPVELGEFISAVAEAAESNSLKLVNRES